LNIVSPILVQARLQPTALAICVPGAPQPTISYGRLAAIINNVSRRALASGFKRGDVVAIFVSDPVLNIALTLGLIRLGIVTLSVDAPSVPDEVALDALLVDSAMPPGLDRCMRVDRAWMMGDGSAPPDTPDLDDSDLVARIVLTSGTTGQQKAVALTHRMTSLRVMSFLYSFGAKVAISSRFFVDTRLSTNNAYQWIFLVLSRGGALFLRGTDPAETLQAFELYKVQCMAAALYGLLEFLELYERSPGFTCPFEVITAGGAVASKAFASRVRARMCSHLVCSYGATEASPVAVAPNDLISGIGGAVGQVCAGMTVQAVDESDRVLAPGEQGITRVRGDVCVDGYVGRPPGSDHAFRDGWFYPGDIGSVTADGILIIAGRQTVVLNVGGNKIAPEAVEQVLVAFPGVEQAGAFGVGNEIGISEVWAAIVAPDGLDEAALHRHCQARLAHHFVPRRLLRVGALPRNVNGKLDRKRLSELGIPANIPKAGVSP
jgi:acyl-CoA synthetase (AMP-forming)/AMP-acid ligase II